MMIRRVTAFVQGFFSRSTLFINNSHEILHAQHMVMYNQILHAQHMVMYNHQMMIDAIPLNVL